MRPNVDTLIVKHKQTLYDAGSGFEVDTVAICNHMIVLHEGRSHFESTNEVLLFTC